MVGTDDGPAACYGISGSSAKNRFRTVRAPVSAKESVPVSIKSVNRTVYGINGVMSAAFAVFCFVINFGSLNFNFSDTEIPLKVCHIIHGIPETEFHKGSKRKLFGGISCVGKDETVYFTGITQRNKSGKICRNSVFGRKKTAVAKAVAALIRIQGGLCRLPARIPDGIAIFNIIVPAVLVCRRIVITVAGQTQKLCVFVETVAAAGVGNQGKEIL